jgi:beta-galactosidase
MSSLDCGKQDSPAGGSTMTGEIAVPEMRTLLVDRSKVRNTFLLNGQWEIQPANDDSEPSSYHFTIPVPSLVDLASPAYDWKGYTFHWHRITFSMPGVETSNAVFLRIGQSQYGTRVSLNGTLVGGSIRCYTSQEYRIDPFLRRDGDNTISVGVGSKLALPPESAVGNDQEKESFIPGIWGDVSIIVTSRIRVKRTHIVPHLTTSTAEGTITIENLDEQPGVVRVRAWVVEKSSGVRSSDEVVRTVDCRCGENDVGLDIVVQNVKHWSPDRPFLYSFVVAVESEQRILDEHETTFGMREFRIAGGDFLLNGKKIVLRGGNIAFHRFLNDPQRRQLPWDRHWINKVLADIPKTHNFNSFRIHLGQAYDAWYDVADERGILIQNEWQFWRASGTKEQMIIEFRDWLRDNWNHPSIVIWDALNECTEPVVEREVIPVIRALDTSRPWEPADFHDQHPYIYSLGPVLSERRFGFSDSIAEMEQQTTPLVVDEFVWWWLNNDAVPTSLMSGVVERWLGKEFDAKDLLNHQAWLAQEMVELFRRIGADTIQPFVYLSNGNGPTGNWFLKDIAYLQVKPILSALKNAFSPLGVSIELWDRHFTSAEERQLRVHVFNDFQESKEVLLRTAIMGSRGNRIWNREEIVRIEGTGKEVRNLKVVFPKLSGSYFVRAEVWDPSGTELIAHSVKPALVFNKVVADPSLRRRRVHLIDEDEEVRNYLTSLEIPLMHWVPTTPVEPGSGIIVAVGNSVQSQGYQTGRQMLSKVVSAGTTMILLEPEFGIAEERILEVLDGLDLKINFRPDTDRGGYDSYVFPEDDSHAVWKGIPVSALKMFNGGMGGEMVSRHDVVPLVEHTVLARCGLGLHVIAAAEIPYGLGKVIVWRLQMRGRLKADSLTSGFYDRRPDPVAQQLLLNLLAQ